MWAFFSIAVAMSLTTYLAKDDFSIWDNILNTTDLLLVSTITVFIFLFGDQSTKFSSFDKFCLVAVIMITIFWFITKTHLLSHLLVQGILVISYFSVIRRLWQSKKIQNHFQFGF